MKPDKEWIRDRPKYTLPINSLQNFSGQLISRKNNYIF